MREINFLKILKGHEGETFYSPIYGDTTFRIFEDIIEIFPVKDENCEFTQINKEGHSRPEGEMLLFPSKDQRDWNKWIEEQKSKVPKTWSELCKTNKCTIYHLSVIDEMGWVQGVDNTPIEKSSLALLKIHQLIEVGYGGNVLYNKEGHWDGGIYGYTISIRPSSKKYLDGYEIIPIERKNNIVSPIMFKTKEYAEEFIKYERFMRSERETKEIICLLQTV